jgi:hypothetical protein
MERRKGTTGTNDQNERNRQNGTHGIHKIHDFMEYTKIHECIYQDGTKGTKEPTKRTRIERSGRNGTHGIHKIHDCMIYTKIHECIDQDKNIKQKIAWYLPVHGASVVTIVAALLHMAFRCRLSSSSLF